MGFAPKGEWIMDYCSIMGYGIHFSANQLGGPKKVWGIREYAEYGLSVVWVMRESTVTQKYLLERLSCSGSAPNPLRHMT